MQDEKLLEILPKVKGVYRKNAKIKNWFDIDVKAQILYKPKDIADLAYFLCNIHKSVKLQILGAASNVIIKDGGVKGVLIRLGKGFTDINYDKNSSQLKCGSAVLCANIVNFCKLEALSGIEFLSGIPGSIGGAIAMNAGCYGNEISKVLKSVTAIDYSGKIHYLDADKFSFSYRKNDLASKFIFVEAVFNVKKSDKYLVTRNIEKLCLNREKTQPIRAKTGGSTFKNPEINDKNSQKAWQLIDETGLRGVELGGACFSQKHCNFMVNVNGAKAKNLIDLAKKAQAEVKKIKNIDLELEIKIIGEDI